MRGKGFLLALVLATVLAGCARSAPQSAVYPGTEWAWASSPESLDWVRESTAPLSSPAW